MQSTFTNLLAIDIQKNQGKQKTIEKDFNNAKENKALKSSIRLKFNELQVEHTFLLDQLKSLDAYHPFINNGFNLVILQDKQASVEDAHLCEQIITLLYQNDQNLQKTTLTSILDSSDGIKEHIRLILSELQAFKTKEEQWYNLRIQSFNLNNKVNETLTNDTVSSFYSSLTNNIIAEKVTQCQNMISCLFKLGEVETVLQEVVRPKTDKHKKKGKGKQKVNDQDYDGEYW